MKGKKKELLKKAIACQIHHKCEYKKKINATGGVYTYSITAWNMVLTFSFQGHCHIIGRRMKHAR